MQELYEITLGDGTTLNCISITGENKFVKGADRDTIMFVFESGDYSVDYLQSLFSKSANTNDIVSKFNNNACHHLDYSILAGINVKDITIEKETNNTAEITLQTVEVVMGQKSYTEKQEEERIEQLNTLSEVVADMLGGAL